MRRTIVTLCCLILNFSITAQTANIDVDNLRAQLILKINELRISQALAPLKSNSILRKAAKSQSVYMAEAKSLSHDQPTAERASPSKRVKYFSGDDFVLVGENVLKTQKIILPLDKAKVASIVNDMFLSWKNSPGHYANMVTPDYEFGDIDFHYEITEGVIYVTQVFGTKGIKIEGQLSNNEFGLLEGGDNCKIAYGNYDNIVANMGNSIQIEGNKLMFYYHSFFYFNKIFTGSKDGIAIDLVFRDQVGCDVENKIDLSPIHDGILLKPVYKNEILNNNIAESDYRIIAQVGIIPDSLLSKEFSPSVILIQNGQKCKYLIPGEVPSRRFSLKSIPLKLKDPRGVRLVNSGIIESQEINYNFKTGVSIPLEYPEIKKSNLSVHSVEITSFSSVEGSQKGNSILHNQRAVSIKKHVLNNVKRKDFKVTIDAKENWDKMYFQVKYYFADDFLALPKDSIKAILATEDDRLPWDSLLFNQRKSTATINYKGVISDTSDQRKMLEMNLRTAIFTRNFDLANKALFELYHSDTVSSELFFEESVFKEILQQAELTQNVAAVLSKNYSANLNKTAEFLFKWLKSEDTLTSEAQYNLLHLYTLLSRELMNSWDLPAKRLSNVIHPVLIQNWVNENIDSELMLNLNLTFIRYFGQINDGPNISKSFNFIAEYFQKRSLNIEDEIDLVLFFNRWSRYDLTNENLLAKFDDEELNEDALFILLKTLNFYTEKDDDISLYDSVYLEALERNQSRWCKWVDQEFQLLRNQEIKDLFCSKCNMN